MHFCGSSWVLEARSAVRIVRSPDSVTMHRQTPLASLGCTVDQRIFTPAASIWRLYRFPLASLPSVPAKYTSVRLAPDESRAKHLATLAADPPGIRRRVRLADSSLSTTSSSASSSIRSHPPRAKPSDSTTNEAGQSETMSRTGSPTASSVVPALALLGTFPISVNGIASDLEPAR